MPRRLTKRVNLGDNWTCEKCGTVHAVDAYAVAHFNRRIIHNCECGAKHAIERGLLSLLKYKTKTRTTKG